MGHDTAKSAPQAMLNSVQPFRVPLEQVLRIFFVLITGCCVDRTAAVAANTPGLYYEYYTSGISPTPITGMPDWSKLTVSTSSFTAGTTGNFGNPQLSSSDIYCGGYYHGYLYLTQDGSVQPYILGVQSKDGFSLAVDGNTLVAQNSELHHLWPSLRLAASMCLTCVGLCYTINH